MSDKVVKSRIVHLKLNMVKLSIFPQHRGELRNGAPPKDVKHLIINDFASNAQGSKF